MTDNVTILGAMRRERQILTNVLAKEINRARQNKKILTSMVEVYGFYIKETMEIEEKIKAKTDELKRSIEERKKREEQEKKGYYVQKRGRGVSVIKLSPQEKETIQNIAKDLEIERLEEIIKNEDGMNIPPSWWEDTTSEHPSY